MAQAIHIHTLPNGLTLLAERMEHVRSAALNFLVPAGCVYDPPAHAGSASVLSDLITRGAGSRDSRELSLALDNLGLDRDESVGSRQIQEREHASILRETQTSRTRHLTRRGVPVLWRGGNPETWGSSHRRSSLDQILSTVNLLIFRRFRL